MQVEITQEEDGLRIDSYLADKITALDENFKISRSQAQKLLRNGSVTINGKVLKPASKLHTGQIISVAITEEFRTIDEDTEKEKIDSRMLLEPEKIDLEVIFEDNDILVVNKPKGMNVHGLPNEKTVGSLVNALLYHCMDEDGYVQLSCEKDQYFRPGIVHRIDKQTSGILVVAKTDEAHKGLKSQFEDHTIRRKYNCLCHGAPAKSNGKINSILGRHPTVRTRQAVLQDLSDHPEEHLEELAENFGKGKLAKSAWRKLHTFKLPIGSEKVPLTYQIGLIEFELFTGRTHQIRAQMQRLGTPLLFDPLYRTSTRKKTQLHLPIISTQQEQYLLDKLDWNALHLYQDPLSTPTNDPIKNIGQFLHASQLSFVHPITNTQMNFEAPFPPYFRHVVSILRKL